MAHRLLSLLAAASLLASVASAQSAPTITVDPAGENARVQLAPLDADAQVSFAKVFEVPEYGDRKPFALLLTNSSGQPVVGLTMRWTVTSGERTGTYDARTDAFGQLVPGAAAVMRGTVLLPGSSSSASAMRPLGASYASAERVVVDSGERLLVAPGLFVRESVTRERGRPTSASGMPDAIRTATAISVSVDTVILQDGTVLGPDASHTVDAIQRRQAEATAVVEAVRKAEVGGQDGVNALREIANSRVSPQRGGPSFEQRSLARHLMMSPDWSAQLEKISAIQLPNFHR